MAVIRGNQIQQKHLNIDENLFYVINLKKKTVDGFSCSEVHNVCETPSLGSIFEIFIYAKFKITYSSTISPGMIDAKFVGTSVRPKQDTVIPIAGIPEHEQF